MKLNPVDGQGCTKAMVDAVALDSVLHTIPAQKFDETDIMTKHFKKVAPRTAGLWDETKANDYGFYHGA